MKKLLIYCSVLFFAATNIFGSCENEEKLQKRIDESKKYFTEYKLYSNVDSTSTGIKVLSGEIDGHKVLYHLYTGKNKSQMIIWHMESDCKKCKKK